MRQVVAYKRLKIIKLSGGRGRLHEVQSFYRGSNCKALAGKILVFWIDGRLCEVVAYERWSLMEVRLYVVNFDKICS